jgi:hypothetical protein
MIGDKLVLFALMGFFRWLRLKFIRNFQCYFLATLFWVSYPNETVIGNCYLLFEVVGRKVIIPKYGSMKLLCLEGAWNIHGLWRYEFWAAEWL